MLTQHHHANEYNAAHAETIKNNADFQLAYHEATDERRDSK